MAVYKQKGSKFWWYKFTWKGEPVRRSTKQTNKRVAEQIEAAHKTSLAKGEVGIVEREPAPTLRQFSVRFMQAVSTRCAEKPRMVEFYQEKLNRLLEYPAMANAALDAIDESLIEECVQQRRRRVARRALRGVVLGIRVSGKERQADIGDIARPPASEGAGASENARRLRCTFTTTHHVEQAWYARRRRLHNHEDRRP
jgi:hypothetical protein